MIQSTTDNNNSFSFHFSVSLGSTMNNYSLNCDPNKNTFQKELTSKKTKIKARRKVELSSHLSNTLATVSDRKFYVYQNKLLQYGQAEVVTSQDYYPFGMEMMGSSDLYNPTNTDEFSGRVYHNKSLTDRNFRYGFNGKEKDDAFHDNITNYDYGFRIYNPGISRFLSTDVISNQFPSVTPYNFAENSPILNIDLLGLQKMNAHDAWRFNIELSLTQGEYGAEARFVGLKAGGKAKIDAYDIMSFNVTLGNSTGRSFDGTHVFGDNSHAVGLSGGDLIGGSYEFSNNDDNGFKQVEVQQSIGLFYNSSLFEVNEEGNLKLLENSQGVEFGGTAGGGLLGINFNVSFENVTRPFVLSDEDIQTLDDRLNTIRQDNTSVSRPVPIKEKEIKKVDDKK